MPTCITSYPLPPYHTAPPQSAVSAAKSEAKSKVASLQAQLSAAAQEADRKVAELGAQLEASTRERAQLEELRRESQAALSAANADADIKATILQARACCATCSSTQLCTSFDPVRYLYIFGSLPCRRVHALPCVSLPKGYNAACVDAHVGSVRCS